MMSLRIHGIADGLCLAAAPTFAVMALLTAVLAPPDMMCMSPDGFSLGGMAPMYALMSAFHLGPWLKLISFPAFQDKQGHHMDKIVITGFRWAPPFAQGLVRDLRVRWALEEAGLSYETCPVDIAHLKSPAHVQKHPFGMVPTLEADGRKLFESGAILYRIAEDCAALMPQHDRTDTLAWMFAALSTVEPPLVNLFAIDQLHNQEPWAQLGRPAAVEAVKVRLSALSDWLTGRDYLLKRFTAADILMVTVLRFIQHTDLVAGFPALEAYVKRCEARPAFRKALSDQLAGYARNVPAAA